MQASLRKILADSHVAAVTAAFLLASAVSQTFFALLLLLQEILRSLTASNNPFLRAPTGSLAYLVLNVSTDLAHALATVLAAWLLSRWAYGMGPLETLKSYRNRIMRRTNG